MNGIQVETGTTDSITWVHLRGELDLIASDRVLGELIRALASADTLLLDLRDVSFLDSSGLRVVLQADSRAREHDKRLVIVKGPKAVDRVFRIALLDQRLEFVDDPSAVLESDQA